MECGDGLGVSVHCDIIFVHIDVITITLGTPEPHKTLPLQAAFANHLAEKPLGIIEDSPSLRTCRKQIPLRSEAGSRSAEFCCVLVVVYLSIHQLYTDDLKLYKANCTCIKLVHSQYTHTFP